MVYNNLGPLVLSFNVKGVGDSETRIPKSPLAPTQADYPMEDLSLLCKARKKVQQDKHPKKKSRD